MCASRSGWLALSMLTHHDEIAREEKIAAGAGESGGGLTATGGDGDIAGARPRASTRHLVRSYRTFLASPP